MDNFRNNGKVLKGRGMYGKLETALISICEGFGTSLITE